MPNEVKKWIITDIVIALLIFLLLNPFELAFVSALNAREWTLYHLGDVLKSLSREEISATNARDYFLAAGVYETLEKDEYFGAARDKNIIIVQLESFQNMAVGAYYNGEEITPRINAWMREDGMLYFDRFYQQVASGNTSDAEFAVKNSNIGTVESYTNQIYDENYFRGLPRLLSEAGYRTMVMHGYDRSFWNRENMYETEGIDRFYSDADYVNDRIEGIGGGNISGISDEAFYRQSVDILEEERKTGLFFSMIISLSSHHPFNLPDELREIGILPEDQGSTFGNYVNSVRYADRCFGGFIDQLKENGLYDDSLLIVYGDHQGLIKSDEYAARWLGRYDYDIMMNIPLLIHIPGSKASARVLSAAGGQIDILPTAAWLLGFETLDTLYLGQNLLKASEGFVPEKAHLLKGSFIKGDVIFEMSRDGVFENSRAWNIRTGESISTEGLEEDSLRAKRMIETGEFYLREDVLRKMYLEGKSFERILFESENVSALPREVEMVCMINEPAESLYSSEARLATYTPEELMGRLTENPGERLMVYAQDALAVFEVFDERYSGRAVNRGVRYIKDETAARFYAEIQERIIPVIRDLSDWTKVEYLGYAHCALLADENVYSTEQIDTFIKTMEPEAVIMPEASQNPDFIRVLEQANFIYEYESGEVLKRTEQIFSLRLDGLILRRSFAGTPERPAIKLAEFSREESGSSEEQKR
ncbi:MAG: LTA synthase family protein [Clostridiales Family XIII bacterium]|jgi:hypothetical protein|nr:LTA synthase family protein [Clostridiales Family XIII bacterium]